MDPCLVCDPQRLDTVAVGSHGPVDAHESVGEDPVGEKASKAFCALVVEHEEVWHLWEGNDV